MPSIARRTLSPDQWAETMRLSRTAEVALDRMLSGLERTMTVASLDRWRTLDGRRAILQERVREAHFTLVGRILARPSVAGPGIADRQVIPYFDCCMDPGGPALRRRVFTREEWTSLGEEVKIARHGLASVGLLLDRGGMRPLATEWLALADRLDHLKSPLDAEVCRQHPGWAEAVQVFYGPRLADHAELAATVDVPTVRSIRTMTRGDAEAYHACRLA